ncbi:Potassium channel [Coemansia guatemalensis]|uniref:Potassium channel n=1 Tax=Coemansia guatemalensis TaxID=2761395 RepID=A0A9W8HXX5_9FUNG|nr:Potassium channel [Coemansia guatemalensis]
MNRSNENSSDQNQGSDNESGQARGSVHSHSRSHNSSYDDDNSDANNGDGEASDDNGWTPVVKFAEIPKSPAGSVRIRVSRGRRPRANSALELDNQREHVAAGPASARMHVPASARIRGPHSRKKRASRMQSDELSSVRSFPALPALDAEEGSRRGRRPPPVNVSAATSTLPFTPASAAVSENIGLHKRRGSSPQSDRGPLTRLRSSITPFSAPATDDVGSGYAAPATDQPAHPLYNQHDISSDDSVTPVSRQTNGSSSALEDMWFQRARTFSATGPSENPNAIPDTERASESVRSLPRVLTVTSAREKDGGDMETGIDDLPPLRFGREVTNDLRNIQLTFEAPSNQKHQSANPLKHLIRSKHNFRALVTYGGYLFPINILLNVILLDRGWLQYREADSEGVHETVNNPLGYLITSVISLVLIVVSGICFILRCLEFDVLTTTVISIVSNIVNAVLILASSIMYLHNERPKHPDANLTGEYYVSYAGAVVALLNALLLLLDILITPGFRYRGSGMSRQQRILQFNIIVVIVWIGIGGYAWSKIEDWDTITSVMFCMVTVTTIGFGNKYPSKTYSRILQLIYGPLGILMFGLMLLNTRNVIVQLTRDKFRVAKRDLEEKRKKIEQEVTSERVRRRLAARPEHRGWKSIATDMLGRVFLSRNERVRVGVPHWLRRRLDGHEDEHDAGGIDLEAGVRRSGSQAEGDRAIPAASPHSQGNASSPTADGSTSAPEQGMCEHQNITFADPSTRAHSLHLHDRAIPPHIGDGNREDTMPHSMERTYTTASRLSQIRSALAQPGKMQSIRRRIGMHGRANESEDHDAKSGTSDDGTSGDGKSKPQPSGDDSDSETGLDASRTIQADETLENSPAKGGRLNKVLSVASNMRNKVRGRGQGRDGSKGGKAQRQKHKHKHKHRKTRRDITRQLWAALIINVAFWLASAGLFYAFERKEWNYFDAMWFCYVAFTTIGYGDITPATTEGMVTFICLCFIAVGLETFLVVSAVGFFTDVLNQAMKRTRVQKRIARHRKSLAAYEIRRHIKHPNYNPFSIGEDEHMLKVGYRRFKRALQRAGEVITGKRSLGNTFTRHRTKDQRERDERLTEGFIRHTTGTGGFAASNWQPPSPSQSFVTPQPIAQHQTLQSLHTSPPHVQEPARNSISMPPPDQLRRQESSSDSNRSASFSSAPDDILWAFF